MTLVVSSRSFFAAGRVRVRSGELYDSQHPLVLRFPNLFDEPSFHQVEQATRAPGETSTARRDPEPQPEVPVEVPTVTGRPDQAASKAVWVDYARTQQVDTEGLTKAEIVALFD